VELVSFMWGRMFVYVSPLDFYSGISKRISGTQFVDLSFPNFAYFGCLFLKFLHVPVFESRSFGNLIFS